ncbi:MAG: DinB family protein [Balneolaceae bacterium]|jgi:uncharacterized damage-inducible protein DinB
MDPADRLLRLFSYDGWANEQVLISLQENAPFKNSAEAVRTYAHIAGAQELWHRRITGQSLDELEIWPEYNLPEALQILNTYSIKWKELIEKNRGSLDRMISYKNSKGTAYDTMLSDILHHVIIHGQHHRAQIAKLLRNAKITPPGTDFIFFTRSN